ncbi:hypothetical protein BG011_002055 [Mortierella polycephala]|uniref:Ndc10 domain-containing protein n=1 Tax=Mortierella polycephala TaxID=41804 RepID=A0A9P6U4H4_9FUNG|nr:hypothetical protein BG011_002055 [Mortierella polycephala]
MLQGKANDGSCEQYGIAVRNSDVEMFPVGAFSFYFIDQFEIEGGPPGFAGLNHDWENLHLSCGGNSKKKISQSAHFKSSLNAQTHAGVSIPNKVTHRYRGSGARHAQAVGADSASIAQHGEWANQRLATHYPCKIPSDVAMRMTGFYNAK